MQLLVEGGLLGLLAMLVVVATLLPAIIRGQSAAARWATVAFMVACVGGNPSDFIFVVVVMVAWIAYAVPREASHHEMQPAVVSPVRIATAGALGIIIVASAAAHFAAFAYEEARTYVAAGAYAESKARLDLAIALDPGIALYVRQRGALAYTQGDATAAARDFERATILNPADDLAWRSLALAYLANGRIEAGRTALGRAVDLQRSDATKLLLSARFEGPHERIAEAKHLLAEVVQSWPAIAGAPGWVEMLPPSVTTEDIVDAAASRWEAGQPMPERQSDQGLWLAALADRPDLEERAVAEAGIGPILGRATIAVIRCDPTALEVLDQASAGERRSPHYGTLRLRASSFAGQTDGRAADMAADTSMADPTLATWNPLNQNGILGADAWGDRRLSIQWPISADDVPSPPAGLARWTLFPREAVRDAELGGLLHLCR